MLKRRFGDRDGLASAARRLAALPDLGTALDAVTGATTFEELTEAQTSSATV